MLPSYKSVLTIAAAAGPAPCRRAFPAASIATFRAWQQRDDRPTVLVKIVPSPLERAMLDTVNAGWPTFGLDPRDNRNFDPQGDHLHFNLNTWQYNSTKVEGIVVTSALREHRYTIAVLLPRGHPEGDKAFRGDNRRLICDGTELNVPGLQVLERDGVPQLDPIADEPYEEIQEWDLSIPWRSLPFWFFDATEAEKRWREEQAGGAGKTD